MDNLDYIDTYFGGGFPPEESRQFEKRIAEDPEFAREVSFYLGTLASLKETNLAARKARFGELYRERAGKARVRRMNPRILVAAAAAILAAVVLSWLFFRGPADAPAIADRYIRQNLAVLPVKMGVGDRIQAGIKSYNDGRFSDALQQFEDLLLVDSLHAAVLLDAGLVSLRMENYDKALAYFTKLASHTDPGINPALFYEALTLLKRNRDGDSHEAKELLKRIVQLDLDKKNDAKELLGKL